MNQVYANHDIQILHRNYLLAWIIHMPFSVLDRLNYQAWLNEGSPVSNQSAPIAKRKDGIMATRKANVNRRESYVLRQVFDDCILTDLVIKYHQR